jgi:hypothetical protein
LTVPLIIDVAQHIWVATRDKLWHDPHLQSSKHECVQGSMPVRHWVNKMRAAGRM